MRRKRDDKNLAIAVSLIVIVIITYLMTIAAAYILTNK